MCVCVACMVEKHNGAAQTDRRSYRPTDGPTALPPPIPTRNSIVSICITYMYMYGLLVKRSVLTWMAHRTREQYYNIMQKKTVHTRVHIVCARCLAAEYSATINI